MKTLNLSSREMSLLAAEAGLARCQWGCGAWTKYKECVDCQKLREEIEARPEIAQQMLKQHYRTEMKAAAGRTKTKNK